MGHACGDIFVKCVCVCVCCLWWEVGVDGVTRLKGMGIAIEKYTIPR